MGKIRSDWGRKQPKTCVWVLAVGGKGILQRSQFFRRPFVLCPIRQTAGHPQRGFYPRMNREDWIRMFGRKIAGKAHTADWFILSLAYLTKRSSETEIGFQTTFFCLTGNYAPNTFKRFSTGSKAFSPAGASMPPITICARKSQLSGRFHSLAMAASGSGL